MSLSISTVFVATKAPMIPANTSPLPAVASQGVATGSSMSKSSFATYVIDPLSRSFFIEAKVAADKDLRPNQIALVQILDYSTPNAIAIPVNTLQNDETGKYVMVAVKDGDKTVAAKRVIKTGLIYKGTVEVLTGLTEGEELIITGYQNLNEGDLIKL